METEEKVEAKGSRFNFSPKGLENLDALKEQIGAPSRSETIRYALWFLQCVVDETKKWHKIRLYKEGVWEIIIPLPPPYGEEKGEEQMGSGAMTD